MQISTYFPSTWIGDWLYGVSLFPVEFLLRELFFRIAKSNNCCKETMIEYYKKKFQKFEYKENQIFPHSNRATQCIARKALLFFQASNVALIEEGLFRFGLQYAILTFIPSYLYTGGEVSEETQLFNSMLRVITTATLFGLAHWKSTEIRLEREGKRVTPQDIQKERNFQVIGACVSGFVYSTGFEMRNQSFWAAHGCHTMWNFIHDLLVIKTESPHSFKHQQKKARLLVEHKMTKDFSMNSS